MKIETAPPIIAKCRELLRRLVAAFTNNHEQIQIETATVFEGAGTRFILRVHRAEHSKVVGRSGKHVKALQGIVAGIAKHQRCALLLALDEPRFGTKQDGADVAEWKAVEVEKLLAETMEAIGGGSIDALDTEGCTHYHCQRAGVPQNVLEAVETIFSAIGHSHGRTVEFAFM